jgi:hypothetical protein
MGHYVDSCDSSCGRGCDRAQPGPAAAGRGRGTPCHPVRRSHTPRRRPGPPGSHVAHPALRLPDVSGDRRTGRGPLSSRLGADVGERRFERRPWPRLIGRRHCTRTAQISHTPTEAISPDVSSPRRPQDRPRTPFRNCPPRAPASTLSTRVVPGPGVTASLQPTDPRADHTHPRQRRQVMRLSGNRSVPWGSIRSSGPRSTSSDGDRSAPSAGGALPSLAPHVPAPNARPTRCRATVHANGGGRDEIARSCEAAR